ncbi:PREDICTED: uncharacterized protein LOC109585614 [Amphimedon queenslandica]|uniref:Uncharacterized protein n=3 Tax=Amphimedon queenslandica TaxID=400682 RepID=A0AAN0JKL6_AMPQE|nr:PREDICTED: uncharacterized protein LOC109585614 [Amphimedon queenslandica]|eukprot:XP_019857301.1 PREDICTED: uncharacterized protein LOC109585614 [Amphimedon queenslandica]
MSRYMKYGLRIGVQENSLSSTDTVELAVVALVGGQFQFPPNTVLVSAVYAISLSKPLLKQLILEIQHCVDLTGQPALCRHLNFAIAPVSTPTLPYQFSIVEGGQFKPDSWYGSIQREEFCLVAILGDNHRPKSSTNGDESEEEEEEQAEEETEEEGEVGNRDLSSDPDKTKDPPGASSGGQEESTSNEGVEEEGKTRGEPLHEEGNEQQGNQRVEESKNHEEPQHEGTTAPIPCTEISSDINSKVVVSTGIVENMVYAGLLYYEEKRAEDLVTFAAAKDLNALLEFIKKDYPHAERGQNILFRFKGDGYIELKFDALQSEPFTGWNIKPHLKPCRFLRCDVDKFGEVNYPLPSTCLVSVYASPGAVPTLHYSIPLDGVVDPKTLFIHRSLRPTPLPLTNTSYSSIESMSASSIGGASPSAVNVNKVKKVINDVLVSHYAALNSLKTSLSDLASQLYAAGLISDEVRETRSMDKFITEFKASLSFKRKLPKVQEHCQKFLSSFIAVRGSYSDAAEALGEDWVEAIRNELGFDFSVDIEH